VIDSRYASSRVPEIQQAGKVTANRAITPQH